MSHVIFYFYGASWRNEQQRKLACYANDQGREIEQQLRGGRALLLHQNTGHWRLWSCYVCLCCLAFSTFIVYCSSAKDKRNGQTVAIKKISEWARNPDDGTRVLREMAAMQHCFHYK